MSIPLRELGRTGVKVSCLGLGGYHLGNPSEEESLRIVRSAVDGGITFLDNCWDYHDGESEVRMGKALADGYRQRAFLMTKLDARTAEATRGQLEQSLKRLRTDVIDLVQIHEVIRMEDASRVFRDDGAVAALVEARKAGKVRFIGFTGHKDPAMHLTMLEFAGRMGFSFDTCQLPLNLMDHHFATHSFEHRVVPDLLKRNIAVLGMKSMADGAILKTGAVTAVDCLRYALSLPTSVVITGCESMRDLDQAVALGESFTPLSPAERDDLFTRTAGLGAWGEHEPYKTSNAHDGTAEKPYWLEEARI